MSYYNFIRASPFPIQTRQISNNTVHYNPIKLPNYYYNRQQTSMSKAFGGFDSHFKKKDPSQNANTQNPVHQGNNLSFSSPENSQPPNKLPSKVKPNPFANPPSFSNPMAIQPPSTSNNPFVIAKSNPPTNNLNLNAPPTNINKAFSPTTVPSLRTNSQTDATRAIVDTNTGTPSNPPKSDGQDKSISEVSTTQSIKDQFMLQLQSKQFTYPKTDNKNSIFHNRNVQNKVSLQNFQVQKPVFQDFLKNGSIKGNPFKKAGPNGETQDPQPPHQPPSQPPPGIPQNPIVVDANKVNTDNTSTTQIIPNANTAKIQNNLQRNQPVAPVVPSSTQNTQNNKETQTTSKPTPTSGQPQKANPFSSVRNNPYQNGNQSRPSPFSHKTNSLNSDKNKDDKTNESNAGKDENNKNNVANNNNTNGNNNNETNTPLTNNNNVSPQNKDVSSSNNTNSVLANNLGPNLPEGTNVMSMFLKKPAAGNPNNNNVNLNNNKLNFNNTDLSTNNNNINNNVLNNNNNSNNTTNPIINISFNNPNNTNTNATVNNKSNNQPTSTTTTTITTIPGNPFPNKMGTTNIFNNNAVNPNNNTNATTTKLAPTLTPNPLTNTNTNIATAPLQPQYQQWPQHPPITDPMMMIQPMYIPFPNFNLNSSNPPPPPPEPEQPQQTNLLATNIANNTTTKTFSGTNVNNVFNTSKSVVETLLTDNGINANNWKKSQIVENKANTNNNVNNNANNVANNNTAIASNTNNTSNTNTNNLFNNNNNNKLTTALFNNNTTNNNTSNTNINTNNKPVPTFFAKVNLPSTNKLLINVPKPQTNSIFNNDNNAFKNVVTQNNANTEKKPRNENPDPNSLIDKYETEDLFKAKAGVPKPAVAVPAPGFPSNLFTQNQPQTQAQPQDPNTNPGLRKPPRMYNQDGSLSNKVPSWKNILPQVKQSAAYKRFLTETIEQQQARLNGRQPQFFDKLKYKIHAKPANSGANVVWITEDDPTYQQIIENQTMKELKRSIVEDEKNKRRQEVEMRKQIEVEEREKEEKERINRPPFYFTLPEDREEQKNEQQHENKKEYRTGTRTKFKQPQQGLYSKTNSRHTNIILKHSSPSSSSSVSSSAFSLVTFYLTLIYLKQNQSKRQIQIQLPSSKLPSLSQNSAKQLLSNYITKHSSQFRMKPSPLIDNIQIHLHPHQAKVSCIIQQRAINLNQGYQFTYQTVENDCQVTGLFIFNQFGEIFFPEKINVTNVNFYDAFEIMQGSFVMNTGKEFPRANEQLRREFVVKLYSCPYADKLRNEGERRKDAIEQKLAKFCKKKGFSFMDIDLETHHWRFKVSKPQ